MIELQNVGVASGAFCLEGLSLRVAAGEYVVLTGPSGAGKTTLLEAIAGLRQVSAGTIRLAGVEVTRLAPAERAVGYVPQDTALFTTMTVRQNVAYGLRVRGLDRKAIDSRVGEVASRLQLEPLLDRWAKTLSGGEARRVAIGRAIAFGPRVVLLDEPLTGLDDAMRDEVAVSLLALRGQPDVAVLHVTHERRDAALLATRVVRLEEGVLSDDQAFAAGGLASHPRLAEEASHE